ncbi:PNK3P-domain-containing protein [Ramicandelaber brevisporus]|nr:PNK3P-domain-containing protein [Ramicandelaber brevisporus]
MDDLAILPTDGPFRLTRVATNKESGDSNAPQFSIKIAAFDMDGTLICPNGKHVHAKNASDWKFYAASVPDRLRQLYIDGYTVVVFSNQAHILQKERHGRYTTFTGRVEGYAPKIGCPLVVFAAAGDDAFRKPRIGMWNYLLHLARQQCGNDARVTVDWDTSFYVGDAAGRLARKVNRFAVPKDHSEADWRFAQNVGIRFLTPEEYFMDLSSAESGLVNVDRSSAFVPRSLVSSTDAISPSTDGQELIVMVGFPASGKSSFAKQIFVSAGYVYINQDTLRSAHRCLSETKTALAAGQSVVVDNTNRDAKTRKPYVDAAKQYPGCRIKCVFVDVGLEHARHNNYFRSCGASKWLRYDSKWTVEEYEQFVAKGDAVVGNLVPKVAYNTMASQLEEPATTEGFNEVVRLVPPLKFTNKHDETVWRMYFTD